MLDFYLNRALTAMNTLEIKELPLSSKASICWGFFWRGIFITLGSGLCGALIGGVIGFVIAILGAPKSVGPVVGGVVGVITGAFFLYVYVRWLLTSHLGNFRLVLVHAQEPI
jgi:ABC-type amino acid transport system permease subunit